MSEGGGVLRAEWTKLRTVSSSRWLVLAALVATVLVSAAATAMVSTSQCPSPTTCFEDTPRLSLFGVRLGQVAVVVLSVLAGTNEYATRMVQVTLAATPRREAVLAAKAAVVTAVALGAGALGVGGSLAAGRGILPANGFTPANGYPPLSLADGATLRAAVGSVFYLGLIALLSLGIGMAVRDTAGAVTVVMALLYLAPVIAIFVSDPRWQERLDRFAPMTAGLAVQATRDVGSLPIGPWAGLGVLAAYAGGAVLVGGMLFRFRDA